MEYSFFGKTGLKVSRLCLGTMTFTSRGGHQSLCDQETAWAIMDRFVEAGGNFIDTADTYWNGDSERVIGNWMEARDHDRSKLIIATKCGNHDIKGNENAPGLSRHNIIRSVEDSLKRLKTSYIDILYTHVWDEGTPLAETLATLNSLVEQGKVRYVGCSNLTGWQLQLASIEGSKLTQGGYVALQQQYNLLCREVEFEVTKVADREGIALIPWSPLKGGWLSGKMSRNAGAPPAGSRVQATERDGNKSQANPDWESMAGREQTWNIIDKLGEIAKVNKKNIAQTSIRWLLEQPNVPSVIIGVKTMAQLEDNLGAVGWSLNPKQVAELETVSRVQEPYPYEMINRINLANERVRGKDVKLPRTAELMKAIQPK